MTEIKKWPPIPEERRKKYLDLFDDKVCNSAPVETAEGLELHLVNRLENLTAKMSSASPRTSTESGAVDYYSDRYFSRDFFESAIPIRDMMVRK